MAMDEMTKKKRKKLSSLADLEMPAMESEELELDLDLEEGEDPELAGELEGEEDILAEDGELDLSDEAASPLADVSDDELMAELEARGLSAALPPRSKRKSRKAPEDLMSEASDEDGDFVIRA